MMLLLAISGSPGLPPYLRKAIRCIKPDVVEKALDRLEISMLLNLSDGVEELSKICVDPELPTSIQQRAHLLIDLVARALYQSN